MDEILVAKVFWMGEYASKNFLNVGHNLGGSSQSWLGLVFYLLPFGQYNEDFTNLSITNGLWVFNGIFVGSICMTKKSHQFSQ